MRPRFPQIPSSATVPADAAVGRPCQPGGRGLGCLRYVRRGTGSRPSRPRPPRPRLLPRSGSTRPTPLRPPKCRGRGGAPIARHRSDRCPARSRRARSGRRARVLRPEHGACSSPTCPATSAGPRRAAGGLPQALRVGSGNQRFSPESDGTARPRWSTRRPSAEPDGPRRAVRPPANAVLRVSSRTHAPFVRSRGRGSRGAAPAASSPCTRRGSTGVEGALEARGLVAIAAAAIGARIMRRVSAAPRTSRRRLVAVAWPRCRDGPRQWATCRAVRRPRTLAVPDLLRLVRGAALTRPHDTSADRGGCNGDESHGLPGQPSTPVLPRRVQR